MGVLADLVMADQKAKQDQIWREFDTYKSILSDQRPVEAGGFSDEQKEDALNRIVGLSPGSKKHSAAIIPVFKGLLGLGKKDIGNNPGALPSTSDPSAPGSLTDSPMGAGSISPSALINPQEQHTSSAQNFSPISGMAGVPNSGGGIGVESTPTAPTQPPTQPQHQPPTTNTPQPARSIPQPPFMPDAGVGTGTGRGVFAFPTMQQRMETGRQRAQLGGDTKRGEELKDIRQKQQIDTEDIKRRVAMYQQLKAEGQSEANALLQAGFKPPSGAFTAQSRPINKNSMVQVGSGVDGKPVMGYFTPDGKSHEMPGASIPTQPKNPSAPQQQRDDLLAAYAARLGKTVEQLTPQEKVDAVEHSSGPLKPLEDALKGLHPDWSPEQIKAAASKQYLDNQAQIGRARDVTIKVGTARANELNEVDQEAQSIAEGIISGKQPPVLTSMGNRNGLNGKVRQVLQQKGYDLTGATKDWLAVQSHIRTMNGPTVQRQKTALDKLMASIPMIEEAYSNWQATGLPTGFSDFNKAALNTAARLPGAAGVAARELNRQLAEIIPELASMYAMGNAPTDHALDIAKQALGGDWNEGQFALAIKNIKQYGAIRRNSFSEAAPSGGGNRYWQGADQQNPQAQTQPQQKQPWQVPSKPGMALDGATAQKYMQLAGGDKNKARQLAQSDGWRL